MKITINIEVSSKSELKEALSALNNNSVEVLTNTEAEETKENEPVMDEVFMSRTYTKNLETGELKIYQKGTKVPEGYNDGAFKELTRVDFLKMKKEQEAVEEVIEEVEKEEAKPKESKEESDGEEIKFSDIQLVARDVARAGKRAELKDLLKSHSIQKLSDLEEADYCKFLKEIKNLLGEE